MASAPARGQIYVSSDSAGRESIVLSNHPSAATPLLLLPAEDGVDGLSSVPAVAIRTGPKFPVVRTPSPALATLIRSVAQDHAVTEALVKAVVAVESGFEPNATSPKGAMGLMQLMPETAKRFGARNAYAAEENLRAGTAYLRWLLDLFSGDVRLALAAYNAGESAVMRAGWRVPDIAETRAYVPKVMSYLARFDAESRSPAR
jgi:soluble lytic murein transglycosylase-like protein